MSRILVVEDERHLAEGLRFNLEADEHEVDLTDTGEDALQRLADHPERYDLVVLDVMLPGMDGFAVTGELRQRGQYVPVLILTARGRSEDVLSGFGAGADDYLTKPFELPIFLSRVRGLLRRHEWFRLDAARKPGAAAPPAAALREFAFKDKTIDFEQLEVRVADRRMPLTLMEASLLRYFVENEGRPVARKTILDRVWNVHEDTDTRAIDNFVVRLRRYIEDEPARPKHLQTVRGVGYKFIADPE
ncbi:MAG TPA: response regulator transcription factor [Vicinamibacterales bacterium]|nr:response regulator transcription factor [Vicinamibacterales bacterium]